MTHKYGVITKLDQQLPHEVKVDLPCGERKSADNHYLADPGGGHNHENCFRKWKAAAPHYVNSPRVVYLQSRHEMGFVAQSFSSGLKLCHTSRLSKCFRVGPRLESCNAFNPAP